MKFLRRVVFLLVLIALAAAWALYSYSASGPLPAPKTVVLARGEGVRGIAAQLAQAGVISNATLFEAAALATDNARHFKAGEYNFPAVIPMQGVISLLVQGKVVLHKLTVAEGLTVRDALALLARETALSGDAPKDIPEGSLLPETYQFTYGDTRESLLHRMQKAARDTLAAAWDKRVGNLPLTSAQDTLILASIVEKETGVAEERAHVAAVFENRLKIGMRLQSDPTVAYGIEQAQNAPLARALTTDDLAAPTPYNTYVIAGLPPAPICNPGRASIEAVLHPMDSKDLYFVANGNGGHRFAATIKEHEKNVEEYRKLSAQKAAAAPH